MIPQELIYLYIHVYTIHITLYHTHICIYISYIHVYILTFSVLYVIYYIQMHEPEAEQQPLQSGLEARLQRPPGSEPDFRYLLDEGPEPRLP